MTDEEEALGRLVRIETRLSKLMQHLGLHPQTGEPVTPNPRTPNATKSNLPTHNPYVNHPTRRHAG